MNLNISAHRLTQNLGLGVLAYRLYYAPRGFLNRCLKRGIVPFAMDRWQRYQMEQAALVLTPPIADRSGPVYEVHFLTGKRFWDQTCFCFYSLLQQTDLNLQLVVYDDGTLTQPYIKKIQRLFPTSRIVTAHAIDKALDTYLPASQFPYLRSRRLEYPNLRKLTDIHIGSHGWKLVLDSDMLFFHPPIELLGWLKNPQNPCHMVDVETAYGYSSTLMKTLAGAAIPERINVGICGLQSDALNWEELENWCKTLIETEGTHYYQEQAMIAMLMARQQCSVMAGDDYIVMPQKAEVVHPEAKLHHYVSDSKPWYFRYGWHHIAQAKTH